MKKNTWHFWIDQGGTFTDIVGLSPSGHLHKHKLLSTNPSQYDNAIKAGIQQILNKSEEQEAKLKSISTIKIGTTAGTNALLTGKGAEVVLVTSFGFADAIRIAYQDRPDIFALSIELPSMLYSHVIEFNERIDVHGNILINPDFDKLYKDLLYAYKKGIKSCAIVLMHSYKYPKHENLAAEIAKEIGYKEISLSSQVAPLIKLISRADTTLVNSYLNPILKENTKSLKKFFPFSKILFMQSNGYLENSEKFSGKDCILSGPAGGFIGAIKIAKQQNIQKIISFDMGGTSTDVAEFSENIEHNFDTKIAGFRIRAPMLDIHTVAAGGGSILKFDGERLLVGPDSAGANPGPLAYRAGGPLTITDANIFLGKIVVALFPKIFGKRGCQGIDKVSVESAFKELSADIQQKFPNLKNLKTENIVEGFINIANTKMANAIKQVSIQRGYDLSDYTLIAFGGAGGQHACLVAEQLNIKQILITPHAGVLSALGIGLTEEITIKNLELNILLKNTTFKTLSKKISDYLQNTDRKENKVKLTNTKVLLKYAEADYNIALEFAEIAIMQKKFELEHLKRYGFIHKKSDLIIESLILSIATENEVNNNLNILNSPEYSFNKQKTVINSKVKRVTKFYSGGKWHLAPVLTTNELNSYKTNSLIKGPALICHKHSTTIIEPGWQARLLANKSLLLTLKNKKSVLKNQKQTKLQKVQKVQKIQKDPITLELFNNLFQFIATQMGVTLQQTSHSVNIKERLDFSCAIFNAKGDLIANAPHIPVHLGSMSTSVKAFIQQNKNKILPGDAYATNDPFNGSTHLPDITVISPFFDKKKHKVLFYLASRGHHADIGGISPGSMPADSKNINEEGILIKNLLVMQEGKIQEKEILKCFLATKYPARNPQQNLADLRAQIAANNCGIQELTKLIKTWSQEKVLAYAEFILDNGEESVHKIIKTLNSGSFTSEMDNGELIKVKIEINKKARTACLDFTGSSSQSKTNINAPLAVTRAAVLYVFRCLVKENIPLNDGCLRPLKLIIPKSSILNPSYPAAVVAGNVETSQIIVDTIFAALGKLAASQGSMNNFSFGNEKFQYYETICGGAGAGPGFPGTSAVQTHMTNSRLTDPEILETKFPVILRSFCIRKNSGGEGLYPGGNGTSREIEFRASVNISLLSGRRKIAPHGLNGGKEGERGQQFLKRGNSAWQPIEGNVRLDLEKGDSILIETPGGGGYGKKSKNSL